MANHAARDAPSNACVGEKKDLYASAPKLYRLESSPTKHLSHATTRILGTYFETCSIVIFLLDNDASVNRRERCVQTIKRRVDLPVKPRYVPKQSSCHPQAMGRCWNWTPVSTAMRSSARISSVALSMRPHVSGFVVPLPLVAGESSRRTHRTQPTKSIPQMGDSMRLQSVTGAHSRHTDRVSEGTTEGER